MGVVTPRGRDQLCQLAVSHISLQKTHNNKSSNNRNNNDDIIIVIIIILLYELI